MLPKIGAEIVVHFWGETIRLHYVLNALHETIIIKRKVKKENKDV